MNHAFLGMILGISFFLVATTIPAPLPPILERLAFYTQFLIDRAPPYLSVPGPRSAAGPISGDCSGQTHWIFKMSGLKLPRLESLAMWNGGWAGRRYTAAEGARDGWRTRGR